MYNSIQILLVSRFMLYFKLDTQIILMKKLAFY